ncbi:hypothetical protein M427DRAFT_133339 [Gonapodya prolifera JEL478]|uniref:Protein FAM72 n=1 Tax=Gonapodya prolifera (strain JEL478) TaxID=1344416 RepID=A0A139AL38_GONPJ|nr:hypothetical protein M427DRAFT_133339 [Gonapodya prolifera JEL478]|eukprot:KXS17507.1 hypothetical protein M427DRAFT_133339 [Gonapodya prolifera JEL478]
MLPPPSLGPELHDALDRVLHPQFRCKAVCELRCKHCARMMCQRGMKAILLASSKPGELRVELFSTDSPPPGAELFGDDYTTASCRCLIRDAACLGCGNTVAYNVTKPCATCLQACNNGHLWVLHADSVSSTDRLDTSGRKILRWADLPPAETDGDMAGVHEYSLFCR